MAVTDATYYYVWCTRHGDQSWLSTDQDPLLPCCGIPLGGPSYNEAIQQILGDDPEIGEGPLADQLVITR